MTIWDAHYDGLYASAIASVATLTTGDGEVYSLTVMDKTSGVLVEEGSGVQTIKPACDVRATELASKDIDRDTWNDSWITVNGKTRKVTHHEFRPSPVGEDHGEVRLFLTEVQE